MVAPLIIPVVIGAPAAVPIAIAAGKKIFRWIDKATNNAGNESSSREDNRSSPPPSRPHTVRGRGSRTIRGSHTVTGRHTVRPHLDPIEDERLDPVVGGFDLNLYNSPSFRASMGMFDRPFTEDERLNLYRSRQSTYFEAPRGREDIAEETEAVDQEFIDEELANYQDRYGVPFLNQENPEESFEEEEPLTRELAESLFYRSNPGFSDPLSHLSEEMKRTIRAAYPEIDLVGLLGGVPPGDKIEKKIRNYYVVADFNNPKKLRKALRTAEKYNLEYIGKRKRNSIVSLVVDKDVEALLPAMNKVFNKFFKENKKRTEDVFDLFGKAKKIIFVENRKGEEDTQLVSIHHNDKNKSLGPITIPKVRNPKTGTASEQLIIPDTNAVLTVRIDGKKNKYFSLTPELNDAVILNYPEKIRGGKDCLVPSCSQNFSTAAKRKMHINTMHQPPKNIAAVPLKKQWHTTQEPYLYACGIACMQNIQEMKHEMSLTKIFTRKGLNPYNQQKIGLVTYINKLNKKNINPSANTPSQLVLSKRPGNRWADIVNLQGANSIKMPSYNVGLDLAFEALNPTLIGNQWVVTYLLGEVGANNPHHFINITRIHKRKKKYLLDIMDPSSNQIQKYIANKSEPNILINLLTKQAVYDLGITGTELWKTKIT